MTVYKLYCLGADGKIAASGELEAEDDGDAVGQAAVLRPGNDCELWQLDRLVARVPRTAGR